MALQLNLLHEEISAQRQRQRDPLKLGIYGLIAIGAILFLYYGWNAYQTIQIKSQLNTVQAEWQKVEPQVTAAQKRAEELRKIIDSTKVLDGLIAGRFYWAPLLGKLAACTTANIQITALDAEEADNGSVVNLVLEGVSAAGEPRAAAEKFREHLSTELGKSYGDVKVEFRNLEDLDTVVTLDGAPNRTARFVLSASFNPKPTPAADPAAAATAPEVKK